MPLARMVHLSARAHEHGTPYLIIMDSAFECHKLRNERGAWKYTQECMKADTAEVFSLRLLHEKVSMQRRL